ncbi:hypothetical protein D7207_01650 [Burkholderia cepacia]|nr:hypothetical protein [Burkholderia cepacia]MBA9990688.1 hypothetical protein [Burkholderia cepacia]MBB0014553.1 hypothetical protein [Burkholderia cepacia]MBB0050783.1 hypothetical protein [Burkholderia cepacia]MBB0051234.1 hypothetical protein [Burkholderia cepacia]
MRVGRLGQRRVHRIGQVRHARGGRRRCGRGRRSRGRPDDTRRHVGLGRCRARGECRALRGYLLGLRVLRGADRDRERRDAERDQRRR